MGGRAWTDEEVGIAITLPGPEAARVLGRSKSAVEHVRKRAREGDPGLTRPGWRQGHPWTVGNRTLLARTCSKCGWLLDAKFFNKTRHTNGTLIWRPVCAWCRSKQVMERRKVTGRQASRPAKTRSHRENPNPTRAGFGWTVEDHIVASDPTKTILQKAIETKRSYGAITSACAKNDYRSLPTGLLGDRADGQWQLRFVTRKDRAA